MEKDSKRVTIIITNYNYGKYIKECLDSCLNQSEKAEIIVVDDASTDNSEEILIDYANKRGIRVFFNEENRGYSYCKNVGIKNTETELIVHLDSDDVLLPDSIKNRLKAIDKHQLDMVSALAYRYRNGKKDGYNENSKIHAQTVMIKKTVYEKYGMYDEEMRSKADKLMWYKLGVHPKSPIIPEIKHKKIKKFVALYRKHDKQMHKLRREDKKLNNIINNMFKEKVCLLNMKKS